MLSEKATLTRNNLNLSLYSRVITQLLYFIVHTTLPQSYCTTWSSANWQIFPTKRIRRIPEKVSAASHKLNFGADVRAGLGGVGSET